MATMTYKAGVSQVYGVHATMLGKVVGKNGVYVVVETTGVATQMDGTTLTADHLKTMELTPRQAGTARIGDHVKLVYVVSPSSGLWSVDKVLGGDR